MNISGLVNRVRTEFLDDIKKPYFWSDANIISALSQAERELCRRLYLLSDSVTPAICQLTIVAGTRIYTVDSKILKIERLKYPGVTKPLDSTSIEKLDEENPSWEDGVGLPGRYVLDPRSSTITFDNKPTENATVSMSVRRLPLLTLISKATSLSPEIKELDDEMIHGALKFLYLKPDAETFNVDLSKKWDNQFETDIRQIIQNQATMSPKTWISKPERF